MQSSAIAGILAKDLRLLLRDRFSMVITVLSIVVFGGLYWLLPAAPEEQLGLGLHVGGPDTGLAAALSAAEGLDLTVLPSHAALTEVVRAGEEVGAGLDLPAGFLDDVRAGRPTTVEVLLPSDAPASLGPALSAIVEGLAAELAGVPDPVVLPTVDEVVLGVDRAGDPLAVRDEVRPLLIFLVLLIEVFTLASLVAVEIVQRTAPAVLTTPVGPAGLLTAKTLLGVGVAFAQAALVALVTGALAPAPAVMLTALALGALLATAVGIIAGAFGREFLTIVFVSVAFFVPLAVPAFSVLLPGRPAWWVELMPSYGLVDTLVAASVRGAPFTEVAGSLVHLAVWAIVLIALGWLLVARRLARA